MAFDPDAYLASQNTPAPPAQTEFNPDAYLAQKPAAAGFDPDAYLAQSGAVEADMVNKLADAQAKGQAVGQQVYEANTTPEQRLADKNAVARKIAMMALGEYLKAKQPGELPTLALTAGGKVGDVAAQIVPAIGGAMMGGPAGGGVGMGLGNVLTQTRQMIRGEREAYSLPEVAVNTALGAVPLGEIKAASTPARTLGKTMAIRAAQAEGLGIGSAAAQSLLEKGQLPSNEELATAAIYAPAMALPLAGIEGLSLARSVPKPTPGMGPPTTVKPLELLAMTDARAKALAGLQPFPLANASPLEAAAGMVGVKPEEVMAHKSPIEAAAGLVGVDPQELAATMRARGIGESMVNFMPEKLPEPAAAPVPQVAAQAEKTADTLEKGIKSPANLNEQLSKIATPDQPVPQNAVVPASAALEKPVAPVTFLGHQDAGQGKPPIELWTLNEDAMGKPAGDTVTRGTLEAAGYKVPEPKVEPVNIGQRDASVSTGTGTPTAKEQAMIDEWKKTFKPSTQPNNAGTQPTAVEVPSNQQAGPVAQVAEGKSGQLPVAPGAQAEGVKGGGQPQPLIESVTESGHPRALENFAAKLAQEIDRRVANAPRSDYAPGDQLYTDTGTPVKFISDLGINKKTGSRRMMVSLGNGEQASIDISHISPEPPAPAVALSNIAGFHKTYVDFVRAAMRRGYDESDGLKEIWSQLHPRSKAAHGSIAPAATPAFPLSSAERGKPYPYVDANGKPVVGTGNGFKFYGAAGSASMRAVASIAGGGTGAVYGFSTGDTPQDKLQRAALYASIGATAGWGGVKALEALSQSHFNALDTVRTMWDQGKVKAAMAYTRDVVDGQSAQVSREQANIITHALQEAFPKAPKSTAANALSVVVESRGDPNAIDGMIAKVASSTKASRKWKAVFLQAAADAKAHYDELLPIARTYKAITDHQVAFENGHGVDTLMLDGYVPHRQDIATNITNPLSWLGSRGGDAAPFRKVRTHATFADSIAAGVDPETLNAVDALQGRLVNGNKLVNRGEWVNNMAKYMDAATGQPVLGQTTTQTRADGTTYREAVDPANYEIRRAGNTEFAISKNFSSVFDALNDPSWLQKNAPALLKINSLGKSMRLMVDTYHLGRVSLMEMAGHLAAGELPIPSYLRKNARKTMNILDNTPGEIQRLGTNMGMDPAKIQQLLADHENYMGLVKGGLNMGGVEDAAHADIIHSIPIAGAFNKWLFGSYQRAAMQHVGLDWLESNRSMYPNMPAEDLYRKTAQEVNTWFRNLGRQGLLRSATARDAARLTFLAPQWNEGAIQTEVRGAGEAAKNIWEAVSGKGVRIGMLPRALGTMIAGQFMANQLINLYTRGKFTWQNPEEGIGAKMSAWVPDMVGHGPGFFLNPLSVAAEMSHILLAKYEKTQDLDQSILATARSRLSAVGQPIATELTGTTTLGQKLRPGLEKLKGVGESAIPLPIPAEAVTGAISSATSGQRQEQFPGQIQKQLMSTVGIRTDQAPSAQQRIRALAREYNAQHGVEPNAEYYSTPFQDVTRFLSVNNQPDAERAMNELLKTKTPDQIADHFNRVANFPFTKSQEKEQDFISGLTLEQKQTYLKALQDRQAEAQKGMKLLINVLVKQELAKRAAQK